MNNENMTHFIIVDGRPHYIWYPNLFKATIGVHYYLRGSAKEFVSICVPDSNGRFGHRVLRTYWVGDE